MQIERWHFDLVMLTCAIALIFLLVHIMEKHED